MRFCSTFRWTERRIGRRRLTFQSFKPFQTFKSWEQEARTDGLILNRGTDAT